jgi:ascorbate-specific PTS system EIIC-type component UlaA
MDVIAWIVLGLGAGVLASMLTPAGAASGHAAGRTGERAGRGYDSKRNNQDGNSAYGGRV